MTNVYFGTKQQMTEAYLGNSRHAVTQITVFPMKVAQVKSTDKDGYEAVQVAYGRGIKKPSRAIISHLKKTGLKSASLSEVPMIENAEVGQDISFAEVIKPGTIFTIQGVSKGKGFAGVIKRHGFAGGPRTHGQSDRHRAPGSIGQGTTPGRVHRGKKMAGRMGSDTVTVKNVLCVAVSGNSIWVASPLPGSTGTDLKLTITGQKDTPDLTHLRGFAAPVEAPVEVVKEEVTKQEETK